MIPFKGATPADWGHFEFVLGLRGNLLPVVPDENATPAPGSKVSKFGKIPSAYDKANQAYGLKDWQKRDILDNEVALWRQDARLGLCVRTGSKSGVYAIDVDVDTYPLVDEIFGTIGIELKRSLTVRSRLNSGKFLVPIEIQDRPTLSKRIIDTEAGRIEFLADGQQFVAMGTHPSGARYEWSTDGEIIARPAEFPTLTLIEFDYLWSKLTLTFARSHSVTGTPDADRVIDDAESGTLTEISDEDWNTLLDAMRNPKLRENCADNEMWSEVGYALMSIAKTRPARELFCTWSRDVPKYESNGPENWWRAHSDQVPRSDYRHILGMARRCGWGSTANTADFDPVIPPADPLDIENQPIPETPTLRLVAGRLSDLVRQAEQILNPELYTQGNALVRIGRASELKEEGIKREGDYRSIIRMSTAYLRCKLGELARIEKFSVRAGEWVVTDCPKDFAEVIMEQRDWPTLRPLDAIARAPFVRTDGSVCDEPGYDSASQAFYIPSAEFPELAIDITMADASRALDTLLEPFAEFPFQTPSARSAFAAHILTEAARVAVDRVPMFFYTAPDAGTGKSLLCDMPSTIVHGSLPARRPWVTNSEEIRKTLFASLLAGDRSIAFDNVPTGYKARSAELCAFLTSSVWKDRKLGASEAMTVKNRSVVSASGNNITPVSDMARRSLVIRLDANSAEQKQRRFRIENLSAYVVAHRVELLMAALTIILGWQQNKAGIATRVCLPSFEEWSRMVRDPLIWLGMPDPVETQSEETDDEAGAIDEAFEALGNYFNGREFTAISIRDLSAGFSDTTGAIGQSLILAGCVDPLNPLKIGYWLRECRDKRGGGFKLIAGRKVHSTIKWLFKRIDNGDLA